MQNAIHPQHSQRSLSILGTDWVGYWVKKFTNTHTHCRTILNKTTFYVLYQISDARVYAHAPKSYKNYLLHAPFVLRIIALALIIIVLARPQTTDSWQNSEIEGIDIMLAIDVSTSMLAEDLKPNRLEAAKDVAAEFINGRPNDNVGFTSTDNPLKIVRCSGGVFAAEAGIDRFE